MSAITNIKCTTFSWTDSNFNIAKDLYKKTSKKHRQTLAYAINKDGRYANLNHLPEFKRRD